MRVLAWLLLTGCGAGAMKQTTLASATNAPHKPQAPLAIGARFYPDIATTLDGTTTPNLRLESAVPEILAVEDGALVGKRPGTSAVLITTDDGSVVDFMHVWVSPITKITVARRDGERVDGAIGLAVGEDITLEPALWAGAQRLAGEGAVTWTSSNERAVSVLHDGSPDRRRIRARAPGKSTITIALGDASASIDLEVVP